MAVPRMHHTKSRRNKGRMQIYLELPKLVSCRKCGKAVLPHRLCGFCGFYKGREVIDVLKKLTKKEQKQRRREIEQKEEESSTRKSLSMEELSRE